MILQPGLSLQQGRLVLRRRKPAAAAAAVAVVVDGIARFTLGDGDAASAGWALPDDLFGHLLDLIDTETGRSVLAHPVRLRALRHVTVAEWARSGPEVSGRLLVAGPAPPRRPVPIQLALAAGGADWGSGFAQPDAGGYRFQLRVDRLPAGEAGIVLHLRLGTLHLDETLHVPADAFAVHGHLDGVTPFGARGWAARRDGAPVAVGVWVDGRRVALGQADGLRPDVAAATGGDGRCGFSVPFPRAMAVAGPAQVDVRVLPDGPSLANSPALLPAMPEVVGHFDGLDGFYAGGWAVAADDAERAVAVEAVCDGRVVGTALADSMRVDVQDAGLPTARCGFHFPLAAPSATLIGREIWLRVAGSEQILPGSPRTLRASPAVAAFLHRAERVPPATMRRLRRALTHRTRALRLSLILPAHETRGDWLQAAVDSVRAQWCGNWELIAVDDGSRAPHVGATLAAYARADRRIRLLRSAENVGIARAVNFGIRAAAGDYVAVLDHDDALEPDAVHHMLRAAAETGADLLYSDEVLTGPELDQLLELRARPAWSHDYYLSHPYFVHLVAVRRALAQQVGGWDEALAISADVDFVLRASERARVVTHVPRVLYRWRTHGGSTGHQRREQVMATTAGALTRHLGRLGRGAGPVVPGAGFNQFHVTWPDDRGPVLAVIPTRDRVDLLRACIASLERTTRGEDVRIVVVDHQSQDPATLRYLRQVALRHTVMPYRGRFNYARMNNRAVRRHGGDARYVLFLNNDVEASEPGWLARLRSLAGREEVGAVGPMLLYGNGQIQHAGVLVGFGHGADHAMRFAAPRRPDGSRNPGYNDNLVSTRDYSAVTGACMLMRRAVFEAMGGFDESFAIGYNDTDLCLRVRAAGLSVLYDGQTSLLHRESATRAGDRRMSDPAGDDARLRARWPGVFADGDPFYSPLLAQSGRDHQLRDDPPGPVRYRAVRLDAGRQRP